MSNQNRHNSVLEMVKSISQDQAFVDSLQKRLSERQLIKLLTVLRNRADRSQSEIAQDHRWDFWPICWPQ